MEQYWSSYDPEGQAAVGCAPLALSYSATYNGRRALVLVHIRGAFGMVPAGIDLIASLSTVDAILIPGALSILNGSAVMVVEVQRRADEPVRGESVSLSVPHTGLPCSSFQRDGLPTFNVELGASPAPLSEGEKTAIAVVSAVSVDLQTVAAVGLLRCTPGSLGEAESEAAIRGLVPVALSGSCVGAIQGALLSIGVACVAIVCVTGIWKGVRGRSWLEAAAVVRCPGMVLSVWASMQMGLVVCGGRLVTSNGIIGGGDRLLGAVGLAVGAVLPLLSVGVTYLFVSRRCYRLIQTAEAVTSTSSKAVWLRSLMLPSYELDTVAFPASSAFSTVVGKFRRPSCLWAGLPQTQPLVMLLAIFSTTTTCTPTLVVAGVVTLVGGAVCHAGLQPNRVHFTNYVQGVAIGLNACVLMIAARLVQDPLDEAALGANRALSMVQVGVSGVRLAHMAGSFVYTRFVAHDVLERGNADGTPFTDDECGPIAVFEVRAVCGCRGARQVAEPLMTSLNPQPTHLPPPQYAGREPDASLPSPDSASTDDELDAAVLVVPRAKKANTKSIIASLMDSHRGHNPMVLPYERYVDGSSCESEEEMEVT